MQIFEKMKNSKDLCKTEIICDTEVFYIMHRAAVLFLCILHEIPYWKPI